MALNDDAVTLRGPRNAVDFLLNDALPVRADGYRVSFTPDTGSHIITYSLSGTGSGTIIATSGLAGTYAGGTEAGLFLNASTDYAPSGNGYAFLPVGQTLTQSFTYTVSNPATLEADYSASVTITLEGWAQAGSTGYDELIGGALADHLIGGTGAANALIGGAGDDWYTVQAAGDSVIETADNGQDKVWTPLSVFVLPTNVEDLVFTGPVDMPVLGIGNASDNVLFGRNGRDELYGGVGNDRLIGGATGTTNDNSLFGGPGDDLFTVRSRGDSTIEYAGEGTDTVETSFGIYALQANVENLMLTDGGRHDAAVGNALDNIITGNAGVDSLFGREGNDTLAGGTGAANTLLGQEGDDIYIVAAMGDSVIEFGGQGIDTVLTGLPSFVLRDHVENLTFAGSGTFIGVGSSGANVITGGPVDDFLSGLDGDDVLIGDNGADQLIGGAGADIFQYEGDETDVDRILDFTSGSDRIALALGFFSITPTISLVQGAGATANTTNTSFTYDNVTGLLSFDEDGIGAAAAIPLAIFNAGLVLGVGDFQFI